MQGRRIYPNEKGQLVFSEAGTYGQDTNGFWWARPPKGSTGILSDHEITEHEDATITVNPSILMPDQWHGYLERGVWRTA